MSAPEAPVPPLVYPAETAANNAHMQKKLYHKERRARQRRKKMSRLPRPIPPPVRYVILPASAGYIPASAGYVPPPAVYVAVSAG
ncbi:hypothetical protein EAI_10012 [Harpegnathos saltator]|uniref:Uncharacterized protein n=1 Tax=Harpegnathos saltator TaxID=610380 RepID=E2BJ74_HARSA|nr:hypothetical protein EAI_10012 [Harpegnathos saltator]